ncbi:MAG TPA: hypothetical protein VGC66_07140 [Pyrinomonadaceae bacterium]
MEEVAVFVFILSLDCALSVPVGGERDKRDNGKTDEGKRQRLKSLNIREERQEGKKEKTKREDGAKPARSDHRVAFWTLLGLSEVAAKKIKIVVVLDLIHELYIRFTIGTEAGSQ